MVRRLAHQEVSITGQRPEALKEYLKRYIFPACVIGSMIIGGMCIVADFINPMASGSGIVISVCIMYQYFELIA